MTREELIKRSWKAFQVIEYMVPRMDKPAECLLLSVQFDDELMVLQPLDPQFKKDDFIASIKYCSVPKKKIAAVALNGKKIKDEDKERWLRHGEEDFDINDAL